MAGNWRRTRRWGYAACVWAAAFAALHYYWAVGGDIGLSVSAGPNLASRRPTWFVVTGLWGVGTLCAVGAVLGIALTRPQQQRNVLLRRAVGGSGRLVAAILFGRGVLVEVLLLTNVTHLDPSVGPGQRLWTLTLWNPWFMAGGIAFCLAAANFRTTLPTSHTPGPGPYGA